MRIRFGLALLALAMTLAACHDNAARSDVATESNREETPVATVTSGIPSLDYTVNTALAHNVEELAGLTGYAHVGCSARSVTADDGPPCLPDEPYGTIVEVLPVSGCANAWVRPLQAVDTYLFALGPTTSLLEIYRPNITPQMFGGGFDAEYVAVIKIGEVGGVSRAVALHIRGGRVVWLEGDCFDARRLVAPERVQSYIVEPTQ